MAYLQIPALHCTGIGFIPWKANNGEILLVKCYYSNIATYTIVSPKDMVLNHTADFHAWGQYSNIDTGQGRVEFHRCDGKASNRLWFHDGTGSTIEDYSQNPINVHRVCIQNANNASIPTPHPNPQIQNHQSRINPIAGGTITG
jgi:hypothetical protein